MGVWHPAEKTIDYRFWEEGSAKLPRESLKFNINMGVWRSGSAVDS